MMLQTSPENVLAGASAHSIAAFLSRTSLVRLNFSCAESVALGPEVELLVELLGEPQPAREMQASEMTASNVPKPRQANGAGPTANLEGIDMWSFSLLYSEFRRDFRFGPSDSQIVRFAC